jgi:ATP synthase, F1 gamma subunit
MASLKEVKQRINTVEGTRKITQARQMIASAKLHQYQSVLEGILDYRRALDDMYLNLAESEADDIVIPKKKQGKVGIVILSSNSGMCGSFNLNVFKELKSIEDAYAGEELVFFPIGKKIREALTQRGCNIGFEKGVKNWDFLVDKPSSKDISEKVSYLLEQFDSGSLKSVDVVYTHYKSVAKQVVTQINYLPYTPPVVEEKQSLINSDYIIEPSREELREDIQKRILKVAFYSVIIDSQTAESAARTMAMQLATENANELINELKITYNKLRQQNITNELLDIVGSSFA